MDRVRVLRIIEYVGPRNLIEEQISNSLHGKRVVRNGQIEIRAVTLSEYPEVLERITTEDERTD